MGVEIERKFIVINDGWKNQEPGSSISQGYLSTSMDRVVRVRVINEDAYLTVKSSIDGLVRNEWEYPIPVDDAKIMLKNLCIQPIIEKVRYRILHAGMMWDLDVFSGENEGLIIAEIELESENQPFDVPAWAGKEVTDKPRYYNNNLARYPYRSWTDEEKQV